MSDTFVNLPTEECPICKAIWGEHNRWQQGYCQGKASSLSELDEAHKDAARLKDDIEYNHIPYGKAVWEVARERDRNQAEAIRERNEARSEVERLNTAGEELVAKCRNAESALEIVTRERDEVKTLASSWRRSAESLAKEKGDAVADWQRAVTDLTEVRKALTQARAENKCLQERFEKVDDYALYCLVRRVAVEGERDEAQEALLIAARALNNVAAYLTFTIETYIEESRRQLIAEGKVKP